MRSNRQVQTAANAQHPSSCTGPDAMTATGLSLLPPPAAPRTGHLRSAGTSGHSAAPMNLSRPALALLLAAALAAGCAKSAPPVVKTGAFERSQALIDSGNVAYRAGEYEEAARRYASAAVAKSDDPAAYYGLGMALAKLGRDDEARETPGRP